MKYPEKDTVIESRLVISWGKRWKGRWSTAKGASRFFLKFPVKMKMFQSWLWWKLRTLRVTFYVLKWASRYMTVVSLVAQSRLTLCNPMGCSLPVSPVREILQARILEWVALPSSRGSSWPRDWTNVSCGSCIAGRFFTAEPPGKPHILLKHT